MTTLSPRLVLSTAGLLATAAVPAGAAVPARSARKPAQKPARKAVARPKAVAKPASDRGLPPDAVKLEIAPSEFTLDGPRSLVHLLVTVRCKDGTSRDVTG